jgi:hypothetical protein
MTKRICGSHVTPVITYKSFYHFRFDDHIVSCSNTLLGGTYSDERKMSLIKVVGTHKIHVLCIEKYSHKVPWFRKIRM